MNEEAFIDAYNMFLQGGYRGSRDEFRTLIESNPDAMNDSFEIFKSGGYNGSIQDYQVLIGVAPGEVKKKDKPVLDSAGEAGLSGLSDTERQDTQQISLQPQVEVAQDNTQVAQKKFIDPLAAIEQQEQRDAFEAQREINMQAFKKEEQAQIEADVEEREKQSQALLQDVEFSTSLNNIDASLIDMEEESVVPFMMDNFQKYGFTFEETGIGDSMTVTTADGKETITIDLDPFLSKTEVLESKKLKDFITQFAVEADELTPEESLNQKAMRAQQMRKYARLNPDGSQSSVLFTSFEEDGKHKVIPTLFPKDPNLYGSNKNTWLELGFDEAKKLAEERGEVFEFETQEEAQEFAEGSWKDRHSSDALGNSVFGEEGYDFSFEKKQYQNYLDVRDKIDFIEAEQAEFGTEYLSELTEEERKKYGNLYVNGIMRDDIGVVLKELKEQEDTLFDLVMDDDKVRLREKLDIELDKKYNAIAQTAARSNNYADLSLDNLNLQSLQTFGVGLDQLNTIDPKNEAEAKLIEALSVQATEANTLKTNAAQKYEQALTFYDAKHDQTIRGEFEDNWAAVSSELQKGLDNGNAAEVILQLSTGMAFDFEKLDINNPDDVKKAAKMIALLKGKAAEKKDARVMSRWNRAKGFKETFQVVKDNPLELSMALAMNSIGLMLPYGVEFITSGALGGMATGAVYGGAAGAAVGGVGAAPGAVAGATAGLAKGLRAGFAATSFAMEYSNAFFDAMQAQGLNPLDPQDVEDAVMSEEIWATTKQRGIARGVPIAVVDYISFGLAGKIFKAGTFASRGRRAATMLAERAVYDPIAESTGEALAQINVGDEIDWKEIAAEGLGGFGNNSSGMAVNTFVDTRKLSNIELADALTDVTFVADQKNSGTQISNWATRMERLGQIDAEQNQRIQENLGLSKDADNLLDLGRAKNKPINRELKGRVMQLQAARKEYSATENRKSVFGKQIADINNELEYIAQNKKLLPTEQRALLEGIFEPTTEVRQDVGRYRIDGKRVTREKFIKYINKNSKERLLTKMLTIDNDEEVNNLVKNKLDAVQVRETETVDVGEQARDGQEVGEGVPQLEAAQPETTETQDTTIEIETKIKDDAKQTSETPAGSRLFSEPVKDASSIAQRTAERTGVDFKEAERLSKIDEDRARRIAQTYEKLESNPQDPEVQSSYRALIDETVEQYNDIISEGYTIELVDENPYNNSAEMLRDVNENKTLKIFSTESGFGTEGVTDTDRANNLMLESTTFVDKNGRPMLANDVFRFVHDFFGHGTLGNSFGPIGEENAWNVHSRMYSPLARRAMTTETRGQNSWVNFSGVNNKAQDLINDSRALRKEGKFEEAQAKVDEAMKLFKFADQKNALMPEEFVQLDEEVDVKPTEAQSLEAIVEPGRPQQEQTTEQLTLEIDQTKGRRGINQTEFFVEAANENVDNANKLTAFMGKVFPGVVISTDQQTFDEVVTSDQVQKYSVGEDIIYGMTVNGDIYINPQVHNSESKMFNTAIHEMGHVWVKHLKTTEKGRAIYNQGITLVKETPLYSEQLKKYKGDETRAAEEAMAILIGDKGQSIADAAVKSKFQQWLAGMWNYIKSQFKMSKDLSVDEIQDMNLDGFIGTALADIFSGREIKLTDQQLTELKDADVAFSSGVSMEQIIKVGRQNGFTDASIREVLIGRGFNKTDINTAMEVRVNDIVMPKEFSRVEGGVQEATKLFEDVRNDLNEFTTEETSMSEVRQKGLDLMKAHPVYQAQPEQVQMELLSAFDRTIGTRANPSVQKEISSIRKALRERKAGQKLVKETQAKLTAFIKSALPVSNTYTQAQINKLIRRVAKATTDTLQADAEFVFKIVEQQQNKIKNAILKDMLKVVRTKAKAAFSESGKRRAKGLSKEGQSYFGQVQKVLKAAMTNDVEAMNDLRQTLVDNDSKINELIEKRRNGESITQREQDLVFLAMAMDNFGDVMNMDLSQVQELMSMVNNIKASSIATFKSRRMERVQKYREQSDQATEQIKDTNPELFDEEGNLLTQQERSQKRKVIQEHFKKFKIGEGLMALSKEMLFKNTKDFLRQTTMFMKNLGTLTNLVDRVTKGKSIFTDKVYRSLNRMDNDYNGGMFEAADKMNTIANSIDGITKGYNQIKRMIPTDVFTLNVKNTKTGRVRKDKFSGDQLMRIYALSKNDVQREKLIAQIGENGIQQVEESLTPELKEFVDKTVDFLSNEYYEGVNAVYSQMNDINLGYVENYFPTITETDKLPENSINEGDFDGIFNAETAPALKERTDKKSDIDLDVADFTSALDNHFQTMEKYKSYAEGTKMLNAFFQIPAVDALLTEMGILRNMKKAVNDAVNPNAGMKDNLSIRALDTLQVKFTGFALAFKAIQILKQATSFINAYSDYSYFPKDSKIPKPLRKALDLPMFMVDGAKVALSLAKDLVGKDGAINQAIKISPTFRKRVEQGLEGDIYGLESGSKTFKPVSKTNTKVGRAIRLFKTAAASPTIIGDILGVMGYMINYKRNIANGMSKAEAVEAFNDYNATQQSRRGTDKIPLQMNSNALIRGFTMFGSTLFLQINKVMQSGTNIARDVGNGKTPRSKDIRDFAINAAIANVLFVGVSNIAKFVKGDEEDKEAAIKKMIEAMMGMNLLYQIPYLGATIEGYDAAGKIIAAAKGEEYKKGKVYDDNVVNPIESVTRKIKKAMANEEGFFKSRILPLLEIAIGAQVDPFIGLGNLFSEDATPEEFEDNVYDVIGISPSYRPEKDKSKKKRMSKTDMKKFFPQTYDDLYGPQGSLREVEEVKREIAREKRQRKKELKEEMYGNQ